MGTDRSNQGQQSRAAGVQVIARAAELLRELQASPGGLAQAELAARVGLARSTVHRILTALEAEGLVMSRTRRGRYRLGPEFVRLAEGARHGLVAEIRPFLDKLSRELDETVDLSIRDGDHVTFLDQVEAPQRLRAVSAVGASFPLHCTANGKAVLATLPPDELAALLPPALPAFTVHTVTDPKRLLAELAQVRASGVAFDREEHTEGICAVGTSVLPSSGAALAISVPMPALRFHGREQRLAETLLVTRRAVEDAFGAATA